MEKHSQSQVESKKSRFFDLLLHKDVISLRPQHRGLRTDRRKELFYMLHTFLERGIPIYRTITMMEREFPELAPFSIGNGVMEGEPLSEILHRNNLIDRFVYETIRIGEESGNLKEAFEMVYLYYEDRIRMREELQKIAIYPAIILINTFLLLLFCSEVIFPQLLEMYESTDTTLPPLLAGFRLFKNVRGEHGAVLLFLVATMVFSIMYLLERSEIRLWISRKKFSLPFLGRVYQSMCLKILTWQLSVLARADIRVVDSLDIISQVEEDTYLREVYQHMTSGLKEGSALHEAMGSYPELFSVTELSYIRQAEESGAFYENIVALSLIHQRNSQRLMDRLSAYAQPVILICLGVLVGITVFSIMPLLNVGKLYM